MIALAQFIIDKNIRVQGVKDVAGNIISNFNAELTATDISAATFTETDIASVKAVATDKIEVALVAGGKTFSAVDPSTFVVYDAATGGNAKLVATKAELNSDKTKVTLTLNAPMSSTAQVDSAAIYLGTATGNTLTKDNYGKALTISTRPVVADAIAPTLTKVEVVSTTKNQFKLTFSENVTVASAVDNLKKDLVIKKADGTILADSNYSLSDITTAPSNELVVTITGGLTDGVNNLTVELVNSRELKDTATPANYVKPFAAQAVSNLVVDLTAPTASGFVLNTNTTNPETITITVSEPLNLADGATVTGFTTSTGTIASAVYDADTNTIVLTSAADGEFTSSTTVNYNQTTGNVVDKYGNELAAITGQSVN